MNSLLALAPQTLSAFLASLVECVEALTVILAVASVRGWRPALEGAFLGLLALAAALLLLGPALTLLPLRALQLGIGILLLLFGLRWLKKAILRSAGRVPLHDEAALYAAETDLLARAPRAQRRDWLAIGTACKIVMVEGAEVVFIVVALGSAGGWWLPAGVGAGAALLLVAALGIALHRPLTRVPENAMKLAVALLLSAFGSFWAGEGLGLAWPGEEWSLLALLAGFSAAAAIAVRLTRRI